MMEKITAQHRQKPAYIYIRQSTMGQVRHHQESTERQYALRDKALELGWDPSAIRILDKDLGRSGAQTTGREDFKALVAEVSMGQAGAVFSLEASRLARSNLDWHRLLELCALTQTLVIDEDGCYDPGEFNDGLLLGLKGTMAQAELHFLRARLQGGKLNKAKKGALRFPLPVGLSYDEQVRIVLDPDDEVRGAVQLAFRVFRQTGSAYGVVHWFTKHGLHFPKRAYGGAWSGRLIWGPLTHGRVVSLLKNPSYAGVYVFGRFQYRRELGRDGEIHSRLHAVPQDQWRVLLKDHHEGYITWDEYLANQQRLAQNRTNGEATVLSGAAREGLALLQGLLLCGTCGHKITVRYQGNGGIYPTYECNWGRRDGLTTRNCLSIRCDLVDTAISEQVLVALKPAELELALEALNQLEERDQALSRQWQMRLQRAQYEAQLAERRYQEVDPSNRLVAATLEQRWDEALRHRDELKRQCAEAQQKKARVATPEQKAQIMALARDLPRLWHAPTTSPKDRKRMLRLLIKDITIENLPDTRQVVLHIRWQGGVCTDITVNRPLPAADQVRYPKELVERIRTWAQTLSDEQIAHNLNQEGRVSPKGKPFTVSMIKWVRYRYHIPKPKLIGAGELTVNQIMTKFGVSRYVVYYWIEKGLVKARRLNRGSPFWIIVDDAKEQELLDWVRNSSKIQTKPDS